MFVVAGMLQVSPEDLSSALTSDVQYFKGMNDNRGEAVSVWVVSGGTLESRKKYKKRPPLQSRTVHCQHSFASPDSGHRSQCN